MAINAGHAAGFMRAALPEQVRAARMALFADRVLLGDGVLGILAEANRNRFFAATGLDVGPSRPVTRFTAASFQRSPRMGHDFPHRRVFEAVILILMAGDAGLATHIVAIRAYRCRSFSLFLNLGRFGVLSLGPRIRGSRQAKQNQEEKKSEK